MARHPSAAAPTTLRGAVALRAVPFGPPLPPCHVAQPPETNEFLLDGAAGYVESYNGMLADSAWLADWQGALATLQDMRSLGVTPDVTSYFAGICACRRAGCWEEALHLLTEAWSKDLEPTVECYSHVIRACPEAPEADPRKQLLQELRNWGPAPDAKRFHTTPMLKWTREMKQYGCGVRNEIDWQGEGAIPRPRSAAGSWLLPSQDTVAVAIAQRQVELRHAGWRVVQVEPQVVATLRDKARMIEYARGKGIGASTPKSYASREAAEYPCILKPKLGTFGKDTHVVRSAEEVERFTKGSLASWVLQELVVGRLEYSTTLLVHQGEVVDYVNTLYEYDGEEYVWPFVEEVRHEYVSVPEDHLAVMKVLLSEFSGICCLGYKLRKDGSICIFEVNPRIGGDLVFECPKQRARSLFEKLNFMF